MTGKSGADTECQAVIDALEHIEFNIKNIIGLIFDTTAVNSGHWGGVTVQLQCHIDHDILQIAYRHHIMELVCGGAASTVYGDTESPYEPVFKNFAAVWNTINFDNYNRFRTSDRKLMAAQVETLDNLQNWLQNSVFSKHQRRLQETFRIKHPVSRRNFP